MQMIEWERDAVTWLTRYVAYSIGGFFRGGGSSVVSCILVFIATPRINLVALRMSNGYLKTQFQFTACVIVLPYLLFHKLFAISI